ncbi:hypothetical protein [Rhizobium ruizarguesonis]|uniref:hypothetical protein n=1 Tax=Rhizobium ruizarguesonis TaxID=2081791 RepID=UPI00102F4477|nr:hypothetical protein [Rhizobium ruizarguesonis]
MALSLPRKIILRQFGFSGGQPWFIENTPGAIHQGTVCADLADPQRAVLSRSNYGMELLGHGWAHLDYADYGDGSLCHEVFANAEREKASAGVPTRATIEGQPQDTEVKEHD